MKKKLFIAINLPEKIIEKLSLFPERFRDIPAKWTNSDKLHITILFIGFVAEKKEKELSVILENVAKNTDVFDLSITNLSYAPPGSEIPRMLWANVEKSELLLSLRQKIETRSNNFHPHITLARINTWQFSKIDPEELPLIDEEIDITFKVDSIELMESKLVKGKIEYEILESFQLCHRL